MSLAYIYPANGSLLMIDSGFLDAVYEDRVLLSKLIKVISILNTQ